MDKQEREIKILGAAHRLEWQKLLRYRQEGIFKWDPRILNSRRYLAAMEYHMELLTPEGLLDELNVKTNK